MYKKIMVFGMVLLIMLCTPLPSFANYSTDDINVALKGYPYVVKYQYNNGNIGYFASKSPLLYRTTNNKDKLLVSTSSFVLYDKPSVVDSMPAPWSMVLYDNTGTLNITLLHTNHNIYKENTDELIFPNNDSIVKQEFDGRITLPDHDGYKDNGLTFVFWMWYQLPTGVDSTDVKIDGYIDDSKDTFWGGNVTQHSKVLNTNRWGLNLGLNLYDYGPHTFKAVFTQVSTGKVLGTLTRTFEALEGFIDENGDGLDDRTGQPPYDPLEPPDGSTTPEWDGTIVGFFKYLIDNVKYYNEMLVSGVQTTIGSIGKVPQMLGEVINLPPQIMALFTFGIIISILLRVLGR